MAKMTRTLSFASSVQCRQEKDVDLGKVGERVLGTDRVIDTFEEEVAGERRHCNEYRARLRNSSIRGGSINIEQQE